MRSRKTPAQQQAWSELLLLINDPEWYLDSSKCEKHKKIMEILEKNEVILPQNGIDIRHQRYLDVRPGLEKEIIYQIKKGRTVQQMREMFRMDPKTFAYVRRKHGLPKNNRRKKGKEGI
ncbi:hypothetical protein P7D31_09930 [Enterococcus dongliensis]|uniref:Transcriptional regulator n=1 Tax=Enterococcus dongliensis TaxID=2559925 RepID=A0AAW8TLJ9_9ENTE|nr:hypothetical protein [Enterococcus dongliensis]MDT2637950.1 hypothetical protein [Enterococcus dongliensis]MDT2640434.1 hypothetical protein [Enterococcus dongliensis]MDT2675226.1 hypothetical protein [Enterococcus dongliensis]